LFEFELPVVVFVDVLYRFMRIVGEMTVIKNSIGMIYEKRYGVRVRVLTNNNNKKADLDEYEQTESKNRASELCRGQDQLKDGMGKETDRAHYRDSNNLINESELA